MRRQFIVLATLFALLWCAVACQEGDGAAVAKHLVVVSIDTLRPDMLGAYGYDRPSSPNLDEFAASGVLFENAATVAPWTLPSHASLLTGLYPRHHGAKRHVEALAEEVETLAERLRDAGFKTSAVVNSKFLDRQYGFQRGFDDFVFLEPTHDPETSSRVVDRSLDWLETRGEGRFFLLVHDLFVHSSYRASPRYLELLVRPYEGFVNGNTAQLRRIRKGEMSLGPDDLQHLIDLYVAGIRQQDDEFGRLIRGLKDLGVYQDTLVVVVSDHGEEFLEHGGVLHGRTQYEEMLRVPMIMRGPGLPAGLRVSSLVSLMDVFPTSLALLGLPGADALDGMDLGPSLRSGEPPPERLLFSEADHNGSEDDITHSVRQGRFKLHHNRLDRSMQLYDLESDPGETHDLHRDLPDVAERLMGELRSFTANHVEGQEIAELSTTEQQRLLELGYLEDVATGDGDAEQRVRVVLVTLDTLRYDQLVSADGAKPAMPRLAERAKQGLLFTRFYVPSAVTQPSHASMLTGLQPWEHGVTRNGMVLPKDVPNLVERLQRMGWSTAAIVASFPVTKRFGFGRGFDTFGEDLDQPFIKGKEVWESRWKLPGGDFFAVASDVTDRAIEAIDGADEPKQFFWVHYFDSHSPYGSSRGKGVLKGHVKSWLADNGAQLESALVPVREGYAADVAYLDMELDRLLRHLDAAAQGFETHVLLLADHGESLGEGGYLGHGNRLTEEQLRVPAVLLSPSVTPGRRDDVAAAIDVPRTLLALAGEPAGEGELGGRDLTNPPVAGNLAFGMRRTFSDGSASKTFLDGSTHELEGHRYFQVDEQGRIVRGSGSGALLPADVAGLGASERGRIGSRFESFEAGLGGTKALEDLDPETERALRELGYIEGDDE